MIRQASVFVFVIVMSLSIQATTRMRVDPLPPYFENDRIRIYIETDEVNAPRTSFEVKTTNMSVIPLYDTRARGQSIYVYEGSFFQTGQSALDLRAPGNISGAGRIAFEVKAALALQWSASPDTLVKQLIAANRPPSIVVAEANPATAWVGQNVTITWYGLSRPEETPWKQRPDTTFSMTDADRLVELRGEPSSNSMGEPRSIPVGGLMLMKEYLSSITIVPSQAGTISVSEYRFDGGARGPDNSWEPQPEHQFSITRFSNALQIPVRALPAGISHVPVGPFALDCSPNREGGFYRSAEWPREFVLVKGTGTVASIESLTVPNADYPIFVVPYTYGRNDRRFDVVVHRKGVAPPKVTLSFFDPASASIKTVSCAAEKMIEPPARRPYDLRQLSKPQETKEPREEEESTFDPIDLLFLIGRIRYVAAVFAVLAGAGIGMALRAD